MNPYIYAVHDPPPTTWLDDHLVRDGQAMGWIIFTEELGADPNNYHGRDYRPWSDRGFGVIARLNYGYHPNGTLPLPELYADFAARVDNYISASRGCTHWLIGNEMNHRTEWPQDQPIYPESYAQLFATIRYIVHKRPEHSDDLIIPGAIAPWNDQLMDWLIYFDQILNLCVQTGGLDGIALHTYCHGHDPALVTSTRTMFSPYENRYFEFIHYKQFLERVPQELRALPTFITETNPGASMEPWENVNNGWVQEAYREIDNWNRSGSQTIHCLTLYRWDFDLWEIKTKDQVHVDLDLAIDAGYTWEDTDLPEWTVVYESSMPDFYDWNGIGELTVPVGSVPLWEDNPTQEGILDRPEYDAKITPQPEVHTPPKSAVCQCTRQTIEGALVWAIDVRPGENVRASIYTMGVEEGSGLGMRAGIAVSDPGEGAIPTTADTPSLLSSRAVWGDWWSVHSPDWDEREWKQIWTPVVVSTGARVWVVANGRADFAGPGAAAHWDDLVVEAESNGGTPPPNGDTHTIKVFIDDHLICESEFTCLSGGNNAEVCALAQQIVGLTCSE